MFPIGLLIDGENLNDSIVTSSEISTFSISFILCIRVRFSYSDIVISSNTLTLGSLVTDVIFSVRFISSFTVISKSGSTDGDDDEEGE